MSKLKVAIFGSNASALISGIYFQSQGAEVTLFDPGQHFEPEDPKFFTPEITFWPSSETNFENLGWLEKLIDLNLGGIEKDLPPITFDKDQPTSFIGFGDRKYSSLPAAAHWNLRARLILNHTSEGIYSHLLEKFEGTVKDFSEVSQIHLNGDGVESVEINGSKEIKADHFVFTHSPKEFIELLSEDGISNRIRNKVSRTPSYARVSLALDLPESFDSEHSQNLLFLLPKKDEQEPVLGLMNSGKSIWQAFLPSEVAEDPEALGSLIKQMKKLIGKSIPPLSDYVGHAGIHVQREAFAEFPREEFWQDFKKHNKNASLASGLWSTQMGLAADVEVCHLATADCESEPCREASNLLETSN